MAARNRLVIAPVVTPNPTSAGTSSRATARSDGRTASTKIAAPALSRSHAVPAGPTRSISGSDSAEPNCTEDIAATASIQAGTGSARAGISRTSAPPPPRSG